MKVCTGFAHKLHHLIVCMWLSFLSDIKNGMSNVTGFVMPLILAGLFIPFRLNDSRVVVATLFPFFMSISGYIALGEALYCVFLPLVEKRETGELLTLESLFSGFSIVLAGSLVAACLKATIEVMLLSVLVLTVFSLASSPLVFVFLLIEPVGVLFFLAFFVPLLLLKMSTSKLDKIIGVVYVAAIAIPALSSNSEMNLLLTVHPLHTFFTLQSIIIGQFIPVFSSTGEVVLAISLFLIFLAIGGFTLKRWNRDRSISCAVSSEILNMSASENYQEEGSSVIFLISNEEEERYNFLRQWYQRTQGITGVSSVILLALPFQSLTVGKHMKLVSYSDRFFHAKQNLAQRQLLQGLETELSDYRKERVDHVSGAIRASLLLWEIAFLDRSYLFVGPDFSSITEREESVALLTKERRKQRAQPHVTIVCANSVDAMQAFPTSRFIAVDKYSRVLHTGIVHEQFTGSKGKLSENKFRALCGKPPVA